MNLLRPFSLLICLLCFLHSSFSQSSKPIVRTAYSKEEQRESLLAKSHRLRSEAIVAAATGPLFAGVGFYLLSRERSVAITGSGGWIGVRENNSTERVCGTLLASAGSLATISILPLFIKSARAKKQADLLLSDQTTRFLHSRITVPSLGIRIHL